MTIGIVVKPSQPGFANFLNQVVEWLRSRGCEVVVETAVALAFNLKGIPGVEPDKLPDLADTIIVFGGDGTLLRVARSIQGRGSRILGVNIGSLGFLTEVTLDELYPALESLLSGKYTVDRRSMLKVEAHHLNGPREGYHALNDVVINKGGALARIIRMETFVDEDFVANFLADGLIISTPTGSTAYSLSAGGPILYPTLESVVITPICSHTLTNRPLVVPAESTVRVLVKSGEDVALTVDGQVGTQLQTGDEVHCTQSEHQIRLLQPTSYGFFDVLRKKLKWGER